MQLVLFPEKIEIPIITNLIYLAPLRPGKLGQGQQNLIKTSSCPKAIPMQIWIQSAHLSS